jgi:Uma2 family endonuclease
MAMPSAERRWTAREVRELVAENPLVTPRYELVDGELLVTPSPTSRHQRAVVALIVALHPYVRAQHLGHVLTSPSDVELEPEFLSQPDVYVVPIDELRRMGGRFPAHSLLLVVEVLSPNSARHDRVRKRPRYQRNVPEYWIVDLDARVIERWTSSHERAELVTQSLEWLPSGATAPFVLDVVAYFDDVFSDD